MIISKVIFVFAIKTPSKAFVVVSCTSLILGFLAVNTLIFGEGKGEQTSKNIPKNSTGRNNPAEDSSLNEDEIRRELERLPESHNDRQKPTESTNPQQAEPPVREPTGSIKQPDKAATLSDRSRSVGCEQMSEGELARMQDGLGLTRDEAIDRCRLINLQIPRIPLETR